MRLLDRLTRGRSLHAHPTFGSPIAPTAVPSSIMAVLDRLSWVHEQGLTADCEGCANDGEPGYCLGPRPSVEMQDGVDGEVFCHCGHRIVAVAFECGCVGPPGWHCVGEDSQHWSKGDDPDAECGHCGMRPSEG